MNSAVQQYIELRERTDHQIKKLLDLFGNQIVCRERCCQCCTNLTIFPVEFNAISLQLRAAGISDLIFDPAAPCGYLQNQLCALYDFRPLICRTHGLPIVFYNDQIDPPEYSVSFCPLNFSQADPDQLEFGPDNTLNIDPLNAELNEINLRFIRAFDDPDITAQTRYQLSDLIAMI